MNGNKLHYNTFTMLTNVTKEKIFTISMGTEQSCHTLKHSVRRTKFDFLAVSNLNNMI